MQFGQLKRREFITLIASTAAWPLAARAQPPVIGYLSAGSPEETFGAYLEVFRRTLAEAGYVEGQSVAIEYRWAGDQYAHLPDWRPT
jgi:putative ABC transport system substrate-binding protein